MNYLKYTEGNNRKMNIHVPSTQLWKILAFGHNCLNFLFYYLELKCY